MIKNRVRHNFSIKKEVSEKFRKLCEDKSINMSRLIEKFMEKFIQENNNKDQ